jgi:peroxin-2
LLCVSYRTLLERLLSIRLVYLRSRLSRQVSFEFMNQQIAWAALSDFMLFLLPLINFGRIRDAALWTAKIIGLVQGAAPAAAGAGEQGGPASLAAAVAAGCPCCGASPAVQPHVAIPCHHVFCYYCLSGNRLAERVQARGDARAAALADYSCPACQQVITSQAPLQLQLQQSSASFAAVPIPF